MSSFKYHAATIIGIFLALAVGIFIGSTSSEEVIIRYQRDVIEGLEAKNSVLAQQVKDTNEQLDGLTATAGMMQDLLQQLTRWYWLTNPSSQRVAFVYGGTGFSEQELSGSLLGNLSQSRITISSGEDVSAQVADLLISGDGDRLARIGDVAAVIGEIFRPDVVILAPGPGQENTILFANLAQQLLTEGIQVVAVGKSEWNSLGSLVSHQLYSSVSHLDTPFGLLSLLAVLQGNQGHYGPDNLLPEGLWE